MHYSTGFQGRRAVRFVISRSPVRSRRVAPEINNLGLLNFPLGDESGSVCAQYVDTSWSRAKANRPELNRLNQDAELVSLGIRFVAVTQNIDTDDSNPMARFLLHIMAAFGELEREIIRERVTAGVKAARAKGKQLGRPKRDFRRDEALRLRAHG